jgi:sugar fermentation stimulation protein A
MIFSPPLAPARLLCRYKRFLCDVELDGAKVTAHCPNPGSMMGLLPQADGPAADAPPAGGPKADGPKAAPATGGCLREAEASLPRRQAEAWLSRSANPNRKLPLTLELLRSGGALVGVNPGRANALAMEAIMAGRIPELSGYTSLRREVAYGAGWRVDLLLEGGGLPICLVEVKSVTLARPGKGAKLAEFPDAPTARGARHLRELGMARGKKALRAVVLFVVQRGDCAAFRVAADIDPAFAAAFVEARRAGVEALCYACDVTPERIDLKRPLAVSRMDVGD